MCVCVFRLFRVDDPHPRWRISYLIPNKPPKQNLGRNWYTSLFKQNVCVCRLKTDKMAAIYERTWGGDGVCVCVYSVLTVRLFSNVVPLHIVMMYLEKCSPKWSSVYHKFPPPFYGFFLSVHCTKTNGPLAERHIAPPNTFTSNFYPPTQSQKNMCPSKPQISPITKHITKDSSGHSISL